MKTLLVILIALIIVLIIVAISLYKLGKELICHYVNVTEYDKTLRELINNNTNLINKNRSTVINSKDVIFAAIKDYHSNIQEQLDKIYINTSTKAVKTKKTTKTETK